MKGYTLELVSPKHSGNFANIPDLQIHLSLIMYYLELHNRSIMAKGLLTLSGGLWEEPGTRTCSSLD